MRDLAAIKELLDDATVERLRIMNRRDAERRTLLAQATAKIDVQLDNEFGANLVEAQRVEQVWLTELENAKLAVARERVKQTNYGLLVEWTTNRQNWYDMEKRRILYKTGRRAVLEVCDRDTKFPATLSDYHLPKVGDLFLRIVKRNGEKGIAIVTLHNGVIPASWYPEGEIPERAAQ